MKPFLIALLLLAAPALAQVPPDSPVGEELADKLAGAHITDVHTQAALDAIDTDAKVVLVARLLSNFGPWVVNDILMWDTERATPAWVKIGSTHDSTGAEAFTDLTDTPSSLGSTGQVPAVDSAGTALEFVDPATGDITGVTAGQGLDGGGNSGAVTLNLQDCDNDEILKSTGATGTNTWACEADDTGTGGTGDITGVTATSPLTGGGQSGAVTIGIQASSASQAGSMSSTQATRLADAITGIDKGTAIRIVDGNTDTPEISVEPSSIGPTQLSASGTASSTRFLRGDNRWEVIQTADGVRGDGLSSNQIRLVDCAPNEVLKRNTADDAWECAADDAGDHMDRDFGNFSTPADDTRRDLLATLEVSDALIETRWRGYGDLGQVHLDGQGNGNALVHGDHILVFNNGMIDGYAIANWPDNSEAPDFSGFFRASDSAPDLLSREGMLLASGPASSDSLYVYDHSQGKIWETTSRPNSSETFIGSNERSVTNNLGIGSLSDAFYGDNVGSTAVHYDLVGHPGIIQDCASGCGRVARLTESPADTWTIAWRTAPDGGALEIDGGVFHATFEFEDAAGNAQRYILDQHEALWQYDAATPAFTYLGPVFHGNHLIQGAVAADGRVWVEEDESDDEIWELSFGPLRLVPQDDPGSYEDAAASESDDFRTRILVQQRERVPFGRTFIAVSEDVSRRGFRVFPVPDWMHSAAPSLAGVWRDKGTNQGLKFVTDRTERGGSGTFSTLLVDGNAHALTATDIPDAPAHIRRDYNGSLTTPNWALRTFNYYGAPVDHASGAEIVAWGRTGTSPNWTGYYVDVGPVSAAVLNPIIQGKTMLMQHTSGGTGHIVSTIPADCSPVGTPATPPDGCAIDGDGTAGKAATGNVRISVTTVVSDDSTNTRAGFLDANFANVPAAIAVVRDTKWDGEAVTFPVDFGNSGRYYEAADTIAEAFRYRLNFGWGSAGWEYPLRELHRTVRLDDLDVLDGEAFAEAAIRLQDHENEIAQIRDQYDFEVDPDEQGASWIIPTRETAPNNTYDIRFDSRAADGLAADADAGLPTGNIVRVAFYVPGGGAAGRYFVDQRTSETVRPAKLHVLDTDGSFLELDLTQFATGTLHGVHFTRFATPVSIASTSHAYIPQGTHTRTLKFELTDGSFVSSGPGHTNKHFTTDGLAKVLGTSHQRSTVADARLPAAQTLADSSTHVAVPLTLPQDLRESRYDGMPVVLTATAVVSRTGGGIEAHLEIWQGSARVEDNQCVVIIPQTDNATYECELTVILPAGHADVTLTDAANTYEARVYRATPASQGSLVVSAVHFTAVSGAEYGETELAGLFASSEGIADRTLNHNAQHSYLIGVPTPMQNRRREGEPVYAFLSVKGENDSTSSNTAASLRFTISVDGTQVLQDMGGWGAGESNVIERAINLISATPRQIQIDVRNDSSDAGHVARLSEFEIFYMADRTAGLTVNDVNNIRNQEDRSKHAKELYVVQLADLEAHVNERFGSRSPIVQFAVEASDTVDMPDIEISDYSEWQVCASLNTSSSRPTSRGRGRACSAMQPIGLSGGWPGGITFPTASSGTTTTTRQQADYRLIYGVDPGGRGGVSLFQDPRSLTALSSAFAAVNNELAGVEFRFLRAASGAGSAVANPLVTDIVTTNQRVHSGQWIYLEFYFR